jgi:predicted esterase
MRIACVGLLLLSGAWGAEPERKALAKSGGVYVLVVPDGYDASKRYELVIGLHGMGDTADNFARALRGQLGDRPAILAVPQGSASAGRGYTWTTADLVRIEETVAEVAGAYSIDRRRVLLTGFSAGAAMGWFVLARKPELCTCFGSLGMVVPGRMGISEADLRRAADKVAVYLMVGKRDPNHRVFASTVQLLERLDFRIQAEDPDIGHTVTAAVFRSMLSFFDSSAKPAGPKLPDGREVGNTLEDPACADTRESSLVVEESGQRLVVEFDVPAGLAFAEGPPLTLLGRDGEGSWVRVELTWNHVASAEPPLRKRDEVCREWLDSWRARTGAADLQAKPGYVRLGRLAGKGLAKLEGNVGEERATFMGLIQEKSGWRTVLVIETRGEGDELFAADLESFGKSLRLKRLRK